MQWKLVTIALTAFVFAARDSVPADEEEKPAPTSSVEAGRDTSASRRVGVVVAKNVLLFKGRIRTWNEFVEDLRQVREESSKSLRVDVRITKGAIETRPKERLEKDIAAIDAGIIEQSDIHLGTMSAANSLRYDSIETEADLAPRPAQIRKGSVRNAAGRPVGSGIVLLIPNDKSRSPPLPTPEWLEENELDEIWCRLDRKGTFEIAAPHNGYCVAVISPLGFAFGPLPEAGTRGELVLTPAADLEIASAGQTPQNIALFIHPTGLPAGFHGLGMLPVEIGKNPLRAQLPAGTVVVFQIHERDDGVRELIQVNQLTLEGGKHEKIELHPINAKPEPEAK